MGTKLFLSVVLALVVGCGGGGGTADSGRPSFDAGTVQDAGPLPPRDAGTGLDADALDPDGGTSEDGGTDDDAGSDLDAGSDDAGSDLDAGAEPDTGTADGGPGGSVPPDVVGPFTVTRQTSRVGSSDVTSFVPDVTSPAPLILFKHGFQLATSNYATSLERLASHGFVVVGVDSGGGLFGGPTNAAERDAAIAAIDWATSTAPFASRVDATRIAAAGHSRGGKVAVMIAAADSRVGAALLLDPVNGCGPGQSYSADCPDVTSMGFAPSLTIPVGVMGETNNASGGFMPCAPRDQNYQTVFDELDAAPWAVAWTFTGADHMDFADSAGFAGAACPDGPGDDATIRNQVRAMTVAFFRRHFGAETAMDEWLTGARVPTTVTVEGP
ncbi:MAG: hypothetical protein H6721_33220 [Sandaracinus sp.]|nr:hypothetical protein [Sandaracinus sp.]